MTYERRPCLPAVIGPRMALAMLRHWGPQMEQYAAALESSPLPENREVAQEWRRGLALMRESARQLGEQRDPVAADGSTATAVGRAQAVSPVSPRGRLTVDQVAERVGLRPRRVRQLCAAGVLSATKTGGVWWVDEESVPEFLAARRPVA